MLRREPIVMDDALRQRRDNVPVDPPDVGSMPSPPPAGMSSEIAPRFPARDLLPPSGIVRYSRFVAMYRMDLSFLVLILATCATCLFLIGNISSNCGHSAALQERDKALEWALLGTILLESLLVSRAYKKVRNLVNTGGEFNTGIDAARRASVATTMILVATVVEVYSWLIATFSLISAISSASNPCENRGFYAVLVGFQFLFITIHLTLVVYYTTWRVFHNVYCVYVLPATKVTYQAPGGKAVHRKSNVPVVTAKRAPLEAPPVPKGWLFHVDPAFLTWFLGEGHEKGTKT